MERLRNIGATLIAISLVFILFIFLTLIRFGVGYLIGWVIEWFTGPLYFTNGHVELPIITGIIFVILSFVVYKNKGK